MAEWLEHLGYEVTTIGSIKTAIEMLAIVKPGCVITDLVMPDGNGYQILEELKEINENIPVIVLTADFQEETINRCKNLGAFEVIQKEFARDSLSEIVSKALNLKDG